MSDDLLHLVTQRNQPYGSVRKCCERCGAMAGPYTNIGKRWTDDETEYQFSELNCERNHDRLPV